MRNLPEYGSGRVVREDPEVWQLVVGSTQAERKCRHRINQNQTLQSETGDWNIARKTFQLG